MSLTGPQKLEWQKVFGNAFGWNDFNQLLLGLDDRIENYVAQSNVIRDIILRAIMEYEQRGEEKNLLFAVLAARPNKLSGVAELVFSFLRGHNRAGTTCARNSTRRFQQHARFRSLAGECGQDPASRPCAGSRFRWQAGGTTFGTGFLIAPDLVMTNYQGNAPAYDRGGAWHAGLPNTVTCRFDYRILSDGTKKPERSTTLLLNGRCS